ncbi:hypothetical protein DP114_13705 [Brasilonema sennae CENA114]|uniref:Uncharacterized protein n=1 Tax=Brasilonema sennae CENA114 TaxID=415709 RepID=A0A856MC07_9CYAN|nr:hypothetical protein DP114_13705 [Brasilonema sennae CENA114]
MTSIGNSQKMLTHHIGAKTIKVNSNQEAIMRMVTTSKFERKKNINSALPTSANSMNPSNTNLIL